MGWTQAWCVALLSGSALGCLEDRSPAENPAVADEASLGVRILAPFEGESASQDTVETWDSCAESANTCLETSEDQVGCIRGYVVCAVGAGLEAEHPYLLCVEGLATCWEGSEEAQQLDLCVPLYEDCLNAYLASIPDEPGEPGEPTEPDDTEIPVDPADPFAGCTEAAYLCYEETPEDELGCVTGYRNCLAELGADAPYVACLDSAIACLGTGDNSDACYEAFDYCVTAAYPEDPGTDHGTDPGQDEHPDDYEWAVCEEPTVACYEFGGTNAECLTVYRTCLVDYGLATDDSRILCLDTLIECAGPAEMSADPNAALDVCAENFNQCIAAPIE